MKKGPGRLFGSQKTSLLEICFAINVGLGFQSFTTANVQALRTDNTVHFIVDRTAQSWHTQLLEFELSKKEPSACTD